MAIKVGEPILLGESRDIFSVGVSAVSAAGKLLATGTLTVEVTDDDGVDDATLRRQAQAQARTMVADDPGLLTTVRVTASGTQHLMRGDGSPVPWDGDGFLDAPDDDDKGTIEPKRILNPDSPQAGGF